MSAGRLQLWDKRASLRDKASRLLIRVDGDRELRLREFGTQQRAWAKLLPADAVERDEAVATLGPEAWPALDPSAFAELVQRAAPSSPAAARSARDRRHRPVVGGRDPVGGAAVAVPAGVGARRRRDRAVAARKRAGAWARAIEHYEQVIGDTVPDKLPMPLQVHRRVGEPCPRCGTTLAGVHYKDYVMTYCPRGADGREDL